MERDLEEIHEELDKIVIKLTTNQNNEERDRRRAA